jgi:hypothetical protein
MRIFEVRYDFDMGSIRGSVRARSEDEIRAKFPEVRVVGSGSAAEGEIVESLDDTASRGVLAAVVGDREFDCMAGRRLGWRATPSRAIGARSSAARESTVDDGS